MEPHCTVELFAGITLETDERSDKQMQCLIIGTAACVIGSWHYVASVAKSQGLVRYISRSKGPDMVPWDMIS